MELRDNVISVRSSDVQPNQLANFKQNAFGDTNVKEYNDYNIVGENIRFMDSPRARAIFNIDLEDIGIRTKFKDIPKSHKVDLEITNGFELRDYQAKTHDYIVNYFKDDTKTSSNRLLMDLEPGAGKGFILNKVISTLGLRPTILIKPTYVTKWKDELKEHYGICDDDIIVFNRGKQVDKSKDDFNHDGYKVIIITTNFVTSVCKDMRGAKWLSNFLNMVKSSIVVNDETHQHFDSVSNAIRLLNPPFLIGMSASLVSNNTIEDRRQQDVFPNEQRLSFKVPSPYIHYGLYYYTTSNLSKKHYEGFVGYSHVLYESSILESKGTFESYMNLVVIRVREDFIKHPERKIGDRCIIYFASLEMISKVEVFIDNKLRESNIDLKVGSYTGDNDYEDIFKYDIIIATLGKAGTAIDIPNLLYVLNTVNVASFQLNIQVPGRLRRRKEKLKYSQLLNLMIRKHSSYSKNYLRRFGRNYKELSHETMQHPEILFHNTYKPKYKGNNNTFKGRNNYGKRKLNNNKYWSNKNKYKKTNWGYSNNGRRW